MKNHQDLMTVPLKDRKLKEVTPGVASQELSHLKNTSPMSKNLGPGCQPLAEETFKFLSSNKIMKRYEEGLNTDSMMNGHLQTVRTQRLAQKEAFDQQMSDYKEYLYR